MKPIVNPLYQTGQFRGFVGSFSSSQSTSKSGSVVSVVITEAVFLENVGLRAKGNSSGAMTISRSSCSSTWSCTETLRAIESSEWELDGLDSVEVFSPLDEDIVLMKSEIERSSNIEKQKTKRGS